MLASLLLAAMLSPAAFVSAQTPAPSPGTLEETIPPGVNFDKAEFRFWAPKDAELLRGIVVLVPGSNGDGRTMADDAFWREFAAKHAVALLACRFTDKPHDQSFIEDYVNVSHGSGQALLEAIGKFASRSNHAELSSAPLF